MSRRELSRISRTTQFNTKHLLDGTFEGTLHVGANAGQNLRLAIGDMSALALGVAGDVKAEVAGAVGITHGDWDSGAYTVRNAARGWSFELVDESGKVVAFSDNGGRSYEHNGGGDTIFFWDRVTSGQITVDMSAGPNYGTAVGTAELNNSGLDAGVYTAHIDSANNIYQIVDRGGNVVATSDGSGDWVSTEDGSRLFTVSVATNFDTLVDGARITVDGVDISTQETANRAISSVQAAVARVSDQRSSLGAIQNRLERTMNNLNVAPENLSAAESRIRDVDVAAEMTSLTRQQILLQAGTAMLAQANMKTRSVLQLVR